MKKLMIYKAQIFALILFIANNPRSLRNPIGGLLSIIRLSRAVELGFLHGNSHSAQHFRCFDILNTKAKQLLSSFSGFRLFDGQIIV